MSELMMERIRKNLSALKMKNTLVILDNYLERAVKDELNIVDKRQIDELATMRFLKNRRLTKAPCKW